jgi:HK97 family phage portal protein
MAVHAVKSRINTMPNWFTRLGAVLSAAERKSGGPQSLMTVTQLGDASWSRRGFVSLANAGFARNPVAYACVRRIADAAASVPLVAEEGGQRLDTHPVLRLLGRPNARQAGGEMLESVYAYLQTAGNAYVAATVIDGEVRELHVLRPDRVRVKAGRDGYPAAYAYTAGGKTVEIGLDARPVAGLLHLALFHPLDDHYGMAPLEAAAQSLDIHNAAAEWNKALLDNAARPSGALVYSGGSGSLTEAQFRRLKDELEQGFSGASNAGRPLVLEGGLDWKAMALTPAEMDFAELKNGAAREIALAFGVPPMLLGIPGDNTYANYAEANRAFWRQTVVPLVKRVADDLSFWLAPGFGGVTLAPDIDGIDALAEDRAALWARVGAAAFLTDAEKRALLGV